MQVAKEGYLFLSVLGINTDPDDSNNQWNRRWFKLCTNAILFCFESYSGNLLMTFDLESLNVSQDEIKYPFTVTGKPFVISLKLRERDQHVLLESDCEECMKSWAEQLTRYLPTNYDCIGEDVLTYEMMESFVRQNRYENTPTSSDKKQKADSEEYSYIANDYSVTLRDDVFSPPAVHDHHQPKCLTLNRLNLKSEKDRKKELGASSGDDVYEDFEGLSKSLQEFGANKSNTTSPRKIPPEKKLKPGLKDETVKRNHSLPQEENRDRTSSFHNYYEIRDSFFSRTESNINSNVSENETPESFLTKNSLSNESRPSYLPPKSFESNLAQASNDYRDVENLQRGLGLPEEIAFLESIPHYQELLDNYWLMCVILPNGKVYKQLIDITLPIESSLKQLLHCFTHSHPDPNSFLNLEIVGDLHQTFTHSKTVSKKLVQPGKNLNWKLTFRSQGIMESKILRIQLKEDECVELDLKLLENFLYRIQHLSVKEMFSLSWVSFVKGNFPELDVSVSARHSACIYLIYSRVQSIGKLDKKKFIPSPLHKLSVHLKEVTQYIRDYSIYKASSLCQVFLNVINSSRTGNAISLIAKKVQIMKRKIKYAPCILTVCENYVGMVQSDIASLYDKPDTFSTLHHRREIQGWLLSEPLSVVAIKLTEDKDTDWTKFKIVKTDSMHTVNLLLRDFFKVAPYYCKSIDSV